MSDPFSASACEIILVDNASQDGSADYVAAVFPQVRLVRSASNLGFGGGNNLAAQLALGSYLAFLNPDALVTAGWLEALLESLASDLAVGLATSRILLLSDSERINACGNEMHYTGLTLCRGLGQRRAAMDRPAEVSAVSGAAFAMTRELFLELGGFEQEFFMYMEDTDLSWRARLAGYRCLYVPSSVVYHNYTLHFDPLKTFYQERNRYLILLRGLRGRSLLLLLPALLLAEAVTWGFSLLLDRGRWTNKLRAYAWILRHGREVAAGRRAVQALRRSPDRQLIAACTHRLAFEQTGVGFVARVAHVVFDPLFLVWHWAALALMRW